MCICNSNNNIKIDIFGIIVNQVVTIVGVPSYTSGDQLCNVAAAILNKNPTKIKIIPKLIPNIMFCWFKSIAEFKIYKDYKLVVPVYE